MPPTAPDSNDTRVSWIERLIFINQEGFETATFDSFGLEISCLRKWVQKSQGFLAGDG